MKRKQIKVKKLGTVNRHVEIIRQLKLAILESRYRAAALANKEMLGLYFGVGKLISEKTKREKWGAKVLEQISNDLQNELPGLRGFSATNIKRMRIFYEGWTNYFVIGPTASDQLQKDRKTLINSTASSQLKKNKTKGISISSTVTDKDFEIGPTLSDQFQSFFSLLVLAIITN